MSTILPSASSSKAGVLSTGTQTVAGDKTFSGAITFTGAVTGITANPADQVTQASHGFAVGTVLYHTGSAYARAIASASASAEILGMVSGVLSANSFELTFDGKVSGLTGLTAGTVYFLSDSTPGAITATEPSTVGTVSMPIGIAISTTQIYVKSSRGAVVGGTNARTEIALSNNATTNIQSMAAYEAGEISGWVEIAATTPLKFFVSAPFAKNGAATDYNISPQYVGDTPPVGYSMTITTAGLVQIALPSITGFTSAKINYALNVPAVGATFPLSIDSTAVQFSTVKAKDSGGFIFQENDGTQIGSASDSGVWVFGNTANANNVVTIPNNGYITSNTSDAADNRSLTVSGGGGGASWTQNRGAGIVMQGNEVSGAEGEIVFYAGNAGGTFSRHRFVAGGVNTAIGSQAGAWTFGNSGSATYISGARTNSGAAIVGAPNSQSKSLPSNSSTVTFDLSTTGFQTTGGGALCFVTEGVTNNGVLFFVAGNGSTTLITIISQTTAGYYVVGAPGAGNKIGITHANGSTAALTLTAGSSGFTATSVWLTCLTNAAGA